MSKFYIAAISRINGLRAGGGTRFGPALAQAQNFFTSPARNNNATNIAYFLSDGFGSGASSSLQSVAEVRAFGIGGADLSTLNIIDSDNAVLLSNPADLITEFNASTVDKDTIERVDVKLAGNVIDTITPDQLVEDTLGLTFEGTIDGLEVTREAENEITFEVVFNDGTPTASLDYKITTGQEQVIDQTNDGTKEVIIFSVNQSDFTATSVSQLTSREIIGNDLDNTIEVVDGDNTILANGGNDRIILSGGINLVDGGEGTDTVVINATQADAGGVSRSGNVVNIGTDNSLLNVEFIEFTDVRLATDTLAVIPIVSLADRAIQLTEGNDDSTLATFAFNLSSTTTEDVVIDFATRSNDADAGIDFVENTGQLTIAAGESSGEITLEVLGDSEIEGNEAVFLDLSIVSGGTFADGSLTEVAGVNILDDDSVIGIPITGDDPTVIEGDPNSPSTLNLTLDRFGGLNTTDTIQVEVVAAGDNPIQASDLTNAFSSTEVTFSPGEDTKTIDIAISPDTQIESDETFGIRLTTISGTALVPNEEIIFTILNDDIDDAQPPQPSVIIGTSGRDNLTGSGQDDFINGSRGRDVITTGGGADILRYTSIVEAGDKITDFEIGVDKIDLSQLLNSFNYTGSDAFADGYIGITDGRGSSLITVDPDGSAETGRARPFALVENVAVADLNNADNFIL